MSAKKKIWLLVGLVATLAVGVTVRILKHRDKPSQKPAAEASAPKKQEIEALSPPAVPAASPKQNAEKAEEPDFVYASKRLTLHLARGTIVLQTQDKLRISEEGDKFLNFEIQHSMTMAKIPQGQHVVVGYVEENGRKIAKFVKRDDLSLLGETAGALKKKGVKPE